MKLCDYGCGEEAKYQFKNSKWCCEVHWSRCPEIRKKNSEEKKNNPVKYWLDKKRPDLSKLMQGHIVKEKTKKKISNKHIGKVPWNKGKTNIYSKETKNKMGNGRKGKIPWNKNKKGIWTKEQLERNRKANEGKQGYWKDKHRSKESIRKTSEGNKHTIKQIYKKYPTFAKEEKMRYNPDKLPEKEKQVHCYNHNCFNCKEKGGWFTPTRDQIYNRIITLEKPLGFGGSNFYCSEKCKQTCSSFKKTVPQLIKEDEIKAGIITEETSGGEFQIFREEVLKRQKEELGYNECEYCGNKNLKELVVHHEYPRKTYPQFELDPDNGIVCCGLNSTNKCHIKYGHKTGTQCSTGNLANKIC